MNRRSTFRRTSFPARSAPVRRRKWQWVREHVDALAPNALVDSFDLLDNFKTNLGLNLNFPDIVIWRILIKISVRFSLAPAIVTAADGVFMSLWTDDPAIPSSFISTAQPYSEHYMMWDQIYFSEALMNGQTETDLATVPRSVYKQYDVRTHRKLLNMGDTLILQLSATGDATMTEISFTHSTLLKMP